MRTPRRICFRNTVKKNRGNAVRSQEARPTLRRCCSPFAGAAFHIPTALFQWQTMLTTTRRDRDSISTGRYINRLTILPCHQIYIRTRVIIPFFNRLFLDTRWNFTLLSSVFFSPFISVPSFSFHLLLYFYHLSELFTSPLSY